MNVLLAGEESAGLQTLRMLLDTPHRVVAVLTADAEDRRGATVGDLARRAEIPVLPSELVKEGDFREWILAEKVDLFLNVHSLFVVHRDVLEAPRIGGFNLHPGPLPRYAGLNAPSWAIYYGENRHAVTLHWMDSGIDTGAIAYSAEFDISDTDTGLSLTAKCVRHGSPLIKRLVDAAEAGAGAVPAHPQRGEGRYFGREVPQDGRIEWGRPARDVVNFVRAADYAPFPSPWGHPVARLGDRVIGIAKAALSGTPATAPPGTVTAETQAGGVLVAAGDAWVAVTKVEVDGRYAPAAELLRPGARISDG